MATCPKCNCPTHDGLLVPCDRAFTLDGVAIDIAVFIEVNDFAASDREEIGALVVGAEIVYGGGAAATFTLRRVK